MKALIKNGGNFLARLKYRPNQRYIDLDFENSVFFARVVYLGEDGNYLYRFYKKLPFGLYYATDWAGFVPNTSFEALTNELGRVVQNWKTLTVNFENATSYSGKDV